MQERVLGELGPDVLGRGRDAPHEQLHLLCDPFLAERRLPPRSARAPGRSSAAARSPFVNLLRNRQVSRIFILFLTDPWPPHFPALASAATTSAAPAQAPGTKWVLRLPRLPGCASTSWASAAPNPATSLDTAPRRARRTPDFLFSFCSLFSLYYFGPPAHPARARSPDQAN